MKTVSFIIPVYFNQGSIKKTFSQLKNEVFPVFPEHKFDVIFIDDGSKDESFQELLEIKEENDQMVKLIRFSRNFGQVAAIYAGYEKSNSDAVINIAADLQEPIELVNNILRNFFEKNEEVIVGQRMEREESFYRRFTSKIFYKIMKRISFPNMPEGGFDVVLLSKRVKDELLNMEEANPFWQGQILWTGYPVKLIPYKRLQREVGVSKWTFTKKMKYLLDGVLNYSYLPLRIFTILGIISFILAIIYSGTIIIQFLVWETPFSGWAPLMIVILAFSGMQLLMLGIIGEYLWRTFEQSKKLPRYITKETHD